MSANQKPQGRIYEGPTSAMRADAPWLSAEDIASLPEVTLTIESVIQYGEVEFEAGRKERNVFTLKFVGKAKEMVVNSINRKRIVRKYGPVTKDWVGKPITIYHDKTIRFGKKIVGGIRVKEEQVPIQN